MSLKTAIAQQYTVTDNIIDLPFQDFCRVVADRTTYAPYLYLKNTTQYSYVTAGEKDSMSFSIKENLISDNGQCIEVLNYGQFAANANNKRLRMLVGATEIYDSGSMSFTNAWSIKAKIIHTGTVSSNTTCIVEAMTSFGATLTRTITNVSWDSAQTLKTVVTGVSNADVLQDYQEVILKANH